MTQADSFVSLSEMVDQYLDSLWKNLRFADEDSDLAKAKRAEEESGDTDPPETWK